MLKEKIFDNYKQSADYILKKIKIKPEIAIILGTGLEKLLDEIEDKIEINYKDVPNFLISTVSEDSGKFIFGKLKGKFVICMTKRFHYYEGYDFNELATPVYVLKLLGVKELILTNAAGAVNYNFHPGDICLITDHINFAGVSPTRGNNLSQFGNRFYPIDKLYDKSLRNIAKKSAIKLGIELKEGVYFFTVGPFFETPSEIRAIRNLGGDLVGMSTITETLTAGHCGIKVLAFSVATNYSSDRIENMDGSEVEDVAREVSPKLKNLIIDIIEELK
ncbi:MAG: purine-nucleoside phosphorylase [Peptoniphilus sp.]|uniref:purine-nucleoside phosphorylase n=1 Tax=Peptoniphilus sp. TaxID=1971214 RepID=UPI0025F051A7|nr:purine-nucleoside phosphorylase [Peptoniphilus sp.]MCI5642892.1 purine-nucleoside phosphorylase [Peptoniphilus sp.]MDD7353354.1 purine-nucleoside phosphorylase [Peptoniphilaceae bacterium]